MKNITCIFFYETINTMPTSQKSHMYYLNAVFSLSGYPCFLLVLRYRYDITSWSYCDDKLVSTCSTKTA